MTNNLRLRQVCFFLIAFSPVLRFFMLPSVIAAAADEDMWICSLFNVILDGFTVAVLIYLFKNTDKDFFTLLKEKFGLIVARTVFSLYAAFFIIKSLLPIFEQKDYIELTLYNTFPSLLNFAPLFAIIFYFSIKHLRVVGRAADLVWIFTLIGFTVLLGLSLPNADMGALLPVGARGINSSLNGAMKSLNWFGDGAYLLFFAGNFKWEKHGEAKILLCFLISGIITVLFSVTFYGVFKSIAHRQRFALTEMSKYTTSADTLGRFDYIGIFLILFSSFFSVALPVFFACHAISVAFGIKKKHYLALAVSGAVFAVICLFGEHVYALQTLITEKMPIMFLLFGNIIPILTPLLLIKRKKLKYETF